MMQHLRLAGLHSNVSIHAALSSGNRLRFGLMTALFMVAWFYMVGFAAVTRNHPSFFVMRDACLAMSPWMSLILFAHWNKPEFQHGTSPIPIPLQWIGMAPAFLHLWLCTLGAVVVGLGIPIFLVGVVFELMLGHSLSFAYIGSFAVRLTSGAWTSGLIGLLCISFVGAIPILIANQAGWLTAASTPAKRKAWRQRNLQGRPPIALLLSAVALMSVAYTTQEFVPRGLTWYAYIWIVGLIFESTAGVTDRLDNWLSAPGVNSQTSSVQSPSRIGPGAESQLWADLRRSMLQQSGWILLQLVSATIIVIAVASAWTKLKSLNLIIFFVIMVTAGVMLVAPFMYAFQLSLGMNAATHQKGMFGKWRDSAWSLLPVSRAKVQHALLIESFTTPALAALMCCIIVLSWVEKASAFYTLMIVSYLTLFVLISVQAIPRRRTHIRSFVKVGVVVLTLFYCAWALPFGLKTQHNGFWTVVALGGLSVGWMVIYGLTLHEFRASEGASITGALRRNKWSVAFAAAVSAVTMGGLLFLHQDSMAAHTMQQVHQYTPTSTQHQRLIKDLKIIHELGIFAETPRKRDAGKILNPLIGLTNGKPAKTPTWWTPSTDNPLTTHATNWNSTSNIAIDADIALMEKLLDYDHWEASSSGRYGRYTRKASNPLWPTAPRPEFAPLLTLAEHRLLTGLHRGQMHDALTEVRHLSKLVYSDESLNGALIAATLLDTERAAHDLALERGKVQPGDWKSVSQSDTHAMRRAAMSLVGTVSGWANDEHWRELRDLPFTPFAICGAAEEAIGQAALYPPASAWPGEHIPQFTPNLLEDTLSQSWCSSPVAREVLSANKRININAFFQNGKWGKLIEGFTPSVSPLTMLKLSVPYLRGHTWMDEHIADPRPSLLYGQGRESAWAGEPRTNHPIPFFSGTAK